MARAALARTPSLTNEMVDAELAARAAAGDDTAFEHREAPQPLCCSDGPQHPEE